jgi:hypothetical protein
VIFRNGNINDLLEFASGKKLICYGYGDDLSVLCRVFKPYGLLERIDCVIGGKADGSAVVGGTEKPLVTAEWLRNKGDGHVLLFTQINSLDNLVGMILSGLYEELPDTVFYLAGFLMANPPSYSLPDYDPEAKPLIPKTIHYCWFGRNPKPPLMKTCIESWGKFCPDYEIIEWNEDNYDVNQNRFIREAYQAGKWAFVSDFARMDVIYRYGGVYIDTDVELIKPLDRFLYDAAFCGMEYPGGIAMALPFGAAVGNEQVRVLRDGYKSIPFIKGNGEYNLTPCTQYQTVWFRQLGLTEENKLQNVGGFTVYPMDVFSPVHANLTYEYFSEKSHSIHFYTGSWHTKAENDEKLQYVIEYRAMLEKLHGGDLYKIPLFR